MRERQRSVASTFGILAVAASVLAIVLATQPGCSGPSINNNGAQQGAKEITNSIGMKLVLIPKGKFTMGSPKDENDRERWEKGTEEQHEVEITRPFYLGVYTVTQADYQKVMGTNPSYFSAQGDGKDTVAGIDTSRFPVERVTWEDAVEFCRKLSESPEEKKAGRAYRLPTEAEWEYACRAGTTTPFHYGKSLSSKQANFNGNPTHGGADKGPFLGRPVTVGSYQANAFGLYDMHGNVWQWCADWRIAKPPGGKDPEVTTRASFRVVRGGSFFDDGSNCRSATRLGWIPDMRSNSVGFRLAAVEAER